MTGESVDGEVRGLGPRVPTRPPSVSGPAWHPDPHGRHEHRFWDGTAWTNHVADSGVAAVDEATSPQVATETVVKPAQQAGTGSVQWLVTSVGLALLGGLLMSKGERTELSALGPTETTYTATGFLGMSMFCLAVALFFGRGTFRSIGRVMRGHGSLTDLVFGSSNLKFALLTLAALAGALFALAKAAGA